MKYFVIPEGTKVYIENVERNKRTYGSLVAQRNITFEPQQLLDIVDSEFDLKQQGKEMTFLWNGVVMHANVADVRVI
jgi:hypothetical protein